MISCASLSNSLQDLFLAHVRNPWVRVCIPFLSIRYSSIPFSAFHSLPSPNPFPLVSHSQSCHFLICQFPPISSLPTVFLFPFSNPLFHLSLSEHTASIPSLSLPYFLILFSFNQHSYTAWPLSSPSFFPFFPDVPFSVLSPQSPVFFYLTIYSIIPSSSLLINLYVLVPLLFTVLFVLICNYM